ncbi:hypothetical protein [uncultured Flavobacterium sp.]|uniref:hypothetical protein n=1 Tax=uncultured Flavobacterium sp. TaxID=165435 RepID=UPI0025F47220|nr:hypothetical protein [uncultured Flavobacterium sp.]
MTIRPYSISNNPAILELLSLNTPQYFAESERADLIDYLANHIDHYYVVEVDDIITGCGGLTAHPIIRRACCRGASSILMHMEKELAAPW